MGERQSKVRPTNGIGTRQLAESDEDNFQIYGILLDEYCRLEQAINKGFL